MKKIHFFKNTLIFLKLEIFNPGLSNDLGWEIETARQRAVQFAIDCEFTDALDINHFVRKIRGGNNYEVNFRIGQATTSLNVKTTYLQVHGFIAYSLKYFRKF